PFSLHSRPPRPSLRQISREPFASPSAPRERYHPRPTYSHPTSSRVSRDGNGECSRRGPGRSVHRCPCLSVLDAASCGLFSASAPDPHTPGHPGLWLLPCNRRHVAAVRTRRISYVCCNYGCPKVLRRGKHLTKTPPEAPCRPCSYNSRSPRTSRSLSPD